MPASRWSMANRWRSSSSKASNHGGSILVTGILRWGRGGWSGAVSQREFRMGSGGQPPPLDMLHPPIPGVIVMEDLLNRSALLRQAILSTVDYPLADDSPRLLASMDAALLSLEHAAPPARNLHPPTEDTAQAVDAVPAKAGHPQLHQIRCGAAWRRRRWDRRTIRARVRRCPDRTARAGNGSPMRSWQCSVQDR